MGRVKALLDKPDAPVVDTYEKFVGKAEARRHTTGAQHKVDYESIGCETENAILVDVRRDGELESIWFPLSQVFSIHKHPTKGYMIVTLWIAQKKGLA